MKGLSRFFLVLAVLCLLTNASVTQADPIPSGYDLLETDPGTTYQDMNVPAGFFGPGSDPFDGRVYLKGVPFDCFDPDGSNNPGPLYCGLLPTDTIVRRIDAAGPSYPAVIDIEIVELSLKSVTPLVVTYGGLSPELWEMTAEVHVDPNGVPDPPQPTGTMDIRLAHANGGTFDSMLPVNPRISFRRVGDGMTMGLGSPPLINLQTSDAFWCHEANPLGFPPGQIVVEVPPLTVNFFPGVYCHNEFPLLDPPVSFSVDGGAFNPARDGLTPLTPLPNPAEGLRVPDPNHPNPNDVYALGTAAGGQGYATEGEVFQAAGSPLGNPANRTNVDRMSAALGIGPSPGGPPFMGPFLPNPGGATPAPGTPGGPLGTLGLAPDDNMDALSYGRDSGDVLLFSVDPATVGVLGGAVSFEALASPPQPAAAPTPTNPGGGDPGDEAAGDIFESVQLRPFGSYGPLHFANGFFLTPAVRAINLLAVDELLLGLQAPAVNGSNIGAPEDDLDALELADTGDLVFGVDVLDNATGWGSPDGIPDRPVFFSIDTASPSVGAGVATPDDVLVTNAPPGFTFGVFADGQIDIGLLGPPGAPTYDDIDALVMSDVGLLGALDPFLDEALFSLHPGSPSVLVGPDGVAGTGDEVSAADVFYTDFSGAFAPYASSAMLGLLPTDNLNALDILPAALQPDPQRPPPPIPDKIKGRTPEEQALAAHGIHPAEKKPCRHVMRGNVVVEIFALGPPVPVHLESPPGLPANVEAGPWAFDPETALSEIATEIVSMELIGEYPALPDPVPMFVTVGRELGLPRSTGEITQITPGIDFPAESFFDVYMRVELEGAPPLHNEEPLRMTAAIDAIPPYGDIYLRPGDLPPVLLLDEFGMPAGQILSAEQTGACESDADCEDDDPCTSDSCDVAVGECFHDELPDSDGDGACDVADNCPEIHIPGGQAPLPLGQEIRADSRIEFCWDVGVNVMWVRGPLLGVSGYLIDRFEHPPEPFENCFFDGEEPPEGGAYYYLVTHDCAAGSWQNGLGLEPVRDEALPW